MKEIETALAEQELSIKAAQVFRYVRTLQGFTSYESFAFSTDFPRAQYWRVETGRHNLTLRTLAKVLELHGLTVNEFLVMMIVIDLTDDVDPIEEITGIITRLRETVIPRMAATGDKSFVNKVSNDQKLNKKRER